MMRMMAMALLMGLLSGCGTPKPSANPLALKAQQLEMAADQAAARARYQRAAEYWYQASLRHEALLNSEGVARSAAGLSRSLIQAGRTKAALEMLNQALLRAEEWPTDIQVVLFARRASLRLKDSDGLNAAALDLTKANSLCLSQCSSAASIHALEARLYIVKGDLREAEHHLQAGLRILAESKADNPIERSNLWRLQALVHVKSGRFESGFQLAQQALVIDRDQGLVDRIVMDLELMSTAKRLQGHNDLAEEFEAQTRRARSAMHELQGASSP